MWLCLQENTENPPSEIEIAGKIQKSFPKKYDRYLSKNFLFESYAKKFIDIHIAPPQ